MATGEQTVELISRKQIEMFVPVMKDIAQEFGDRFLLAMLHWCEIGRRSTPLEYWQVFLIQGAIRDCRCFWALQTTGNALKHLLARMVCYSARISPTRIWSSRHHRRLRVCPRPNL